MSEYPQDDDRLVCCCYDYCIGMWLQKCMVHCVLDVIGYVMSDAYVTQNETVSEKWVFHVCDNTNE